MQITIFLLILLSLVILGAKLCNLTFQDYSTETKIFDNFVTPQFEV